LVIRDRETPDFMIFLISGALIVVMSRSCNRRDRDAGAPYINWGRLYMVVDNMYYVIIIIIVIVLRRNTNFIFNFFLT